MPTRAEAIALLTSPGQPFALTEIDEPNRPGGRWRVYEHAPATMADVLRGTAAHGDTDYIVFEGERLTYAEHLNLCAGLAGYLASIGVEAGDRVAVGMRNYPEFAVGFWSAMAMGAVSVPLNAWWTGPEMVYALQDSGAKVLFLDDERYQRLAPHLDELPDVIATIVCRSRAGLPDSVTTWETLCATFPAETSLPDVSIAPDDLASIMYTSGTTGFPKGAMQSHRNHITNIFNSILSGAAGAIAAGVTPAAGDAPPRQQAFFSMFPFFHIGGMSALNLAPATGMRLVTLYKWDLDKAIDALVAEHVTSMAVVPMLYRQILDSARVHELSPDVLGGIASGGAPVPPDLITRTESQFDAKVAPANAYGLTETTSGVVTNAGGDYFAHPDSVGRPVPGADIRIVRPDDGEDQPNGEIGEIWVHGPNVVSGYWNNEAATAASFTDGWFHTGDLGYVGDDGFVYVVDRLKDVVIRGGENVYCAEVEAALFLHPDVADVAVIGLPDQSLGEEVVAVVERRAGSDIDAVDLQRFAAERLARFKVPSTVVFRDKPLPRNATGKILKRDLRDELVAK
ncbi:class I adenylate-forming enzyme family protein [Desertimonas flava]|uniref:class I adenylate-forming enzyme family protein n=1 Tax=Desertimonas flava TaxID=2064846 RepID=UPI000E354CBF|nr:class I adenylate-forming enzyme family protein [Desertimonas flava]